MGHCSSCNFFQLAIVIKLFNKMPNRLSWDTPPDADALQQCLDENQENIRLITSFLLTSGYTDVFISNSSGQVSADFATLEITDIEVYNSISYLLENRIFQEIDKMGQSVFFLRWIGVRDVICGVMYSENVDKAVESELLTEIAPLSYDGWFYYVSDYNAWRNGVRASVDK